MHYKLKQMSNILQFISYGEIYRKVLCIRCLNKSLVSFDENKSYALYAKTIKLVFITNSTRHYILKRNKEVWLSNELN